MERATYNFAPGPAVIPEPVLRQAQQAIWDFAGTGIGILEHSHRGPEFAEVLATCEANIRTLAGIPDDYAVLFLSGGASTQFHMVPQNFLPAGATADYTDTGEWAHKALTIARGIGGVHVAASSAESKYDHIPAEPRWSTAPAYVHFTSNNTVYGTEWEREPEVPAGVPLVCDMSSDIFSRPFDVTKYALIYAGGTKNLGPSALTLVIARKDFIARGAAGLPPMLSYKTFVKDAMPNTPNTFGIYLLGETVKWLLAEGGLAVMQARAAERAAKVYAYLDGSAAFAAHAKPGSRSRMNIVFRGRNNALDDAAITEGASRKLVGLRGHRTAGGLRASMYNAFPQDGADRLVELLREVEVKFLASGGDGR